MYTYLNNIYNFRGYNLGCNCFPELVMFLESGVDDTNLPVKNISALPFSYANGMEVYTSGFV